MELSTEKHPWIKSIFKKTKHLPSDITVRSIEYVLYIRFYRDFVVAGYEACNCDTILIAGRGLNEKEARKELFRKMEDEGYLI